MVVLFFLEHGVFPAGSNKPSALPVSLSRANRGLMFNRKAQPLCPQVARYRPLGL